MFCLHLLLKGLDSILVKVKSSELLNPYNKYSLRLKLYSDFKIYELFPLILELCINL